MLDRHGEIALAHDSARVQATASVGKLFLLVCAAEAIIAGRIDPATLLPQPPESIADSGLWQHLSLPALGVADAALLTAAVSDNRAANALLDLFGHDRADAAARSLGCADTRLLDRIRERRTPEHLHAPSQGRADELAEAVRRIEIAARHAGSDADGSTGPDSGAISAPAAAVVRNWLLTGTDLSMVASAFGLDPLAHLHADRGITLWNKTGTDESVRADVGVVDGPHGWYAYAALAQWGDLDERDEALTLMRDVGHHLRTLVSCGR